MKNFLLVSLVMFSVATPTFTSAQKIFRMEKEIKKNDQEASQELMESVARTGHSLSNMPSPVPDLTALVAQEGIFTDIEKAQIAKLIVGRDELKKLIIVSQQKKENVPPNFQHFEGHLYQQSINLAQEYLTSADTKLRAFETLGQFRYLREKEKEAIQPAATTQATSNDNIRNDMGVIEDSSKILAKELQEKIAKIQGTETDSHPATAPTSSQPKGENVRLREASVTVIQK